jgi:hypothetical protein
VLRSRPEARAAQPLRSGASCGVRRQMQRRHGGGEQWALVPARATRPVASKLGAKARWGARR